MDTTQAALKYLKAKVAPIPVWRDERKNPRLTGTQEYTFKLPTAAAVTRWFTRWPDANVALITGYWELCALDFDDEPAFDSWSHVHWNDVSPTWVVGTGRGFHVWFRITGEIGPSTNYTCRGLNVLARCKGGYCIVPPSLHHTGRKYETLVNAPPAEIDDISDVLRGWETRRPVTPPVQNKSPLPPTGPIRLEHLIPIPAGGKPNARGAIQIKCIFHDDHNASAWVNLQQQRFGCNACWPGLWWDTANIYAMLNGVNNEQALKAIGGMINANE